MRRIGISSGSLVSNTAVSLAGIELSQLRADAGLGPPARLAIPPTYPNRGIPVDRVAVAGPKERNVRRTIAR